MFGKNMKKNELCKLYGTANIPLFIFALETVRIRKITI